MRRISIFISLMIMSLFVYSCKETPTSPPDNKLSISGTVSIITHAVTYHKNITDVTVSIGNNKATTDSSGNWKLEGKFNDTVNIIFQKPGYSYYIAQDVVLSKDQSWKYEDVYLYNLPDFNVSTFYITPVQQVDSAGFIADAYIKIVFGFTPPTEYPYVKKCVIFFNTDSVISPSSNEYLFALELYGPGGEDDDLNIPSKYNKEKYNLRYGQTIYAIAYPVTSMDYVIDKATGKKQYTCIGSGKSNLIKFTMP